MSLWKTIKKLFWKSSNNLQDLLEEYVSIQDEGRMVLTQLEVQVNKLKSLSITVGTHLAKIQNSIKEHKINIAKLDFAIQAAVKMNTEESLKDARRAIQDKNTMESELTKMLASEASVKASLEKLDLSITDASDKYSAVESELATLSIEYETAKVNLEVYGPDVIQNKTVSLQQIRDKVNNIRAQDQAVQRFNEVHNVTTESIAEKYSNTSPASIDEQLAQYQQNLKA